MIWKLAFSAESGQRPAESVDTSDPAEHSRQILGTLAPDLATANEYCKSKDG